MDIVYIETSIVSHATARPTADRATAILQEQARRWMDEQRPNYEVVTSQLVITEAGGGDPDAASRRLAMLSDVPILEENPDVDAVADELIRRSLIPAAARLDALHVAVAALAGVQYLLTQNCRHIANAHVLPRVYRLLEELGLSGLLICAPVEFLGGQPMTPNPILDELYRIRSQILADHAEDLRPFLQSEMERLKACGHAIVKIKQRAIRRERASNANTLPVENLSSPALGR
jgi:hypothetical protein